MVNRYSNPGSFRYGFNGKEKDNEDYGEGNGYEYGFRIYNPRIGRFLTTDPLGKKFPWYTPYQFAGNKPIWAVDLDGQEDIYYTVNIVKNGLGHVEIRQITEDETKAVHWYNHNSTGPSGSGTLVTFKIEQQDMDGKPISLVSQDVFVEDKATWLDKLFRIGSEGEREQYGIAIFGNGHSMDWSIREPKAGRGSEVLDMGEWLRLIEGTRESLTAADLAEDISKNESLVKVIQKIIQLNEAGEKTEAAADHLKKIIDGKKKDNAGNDLNFSEKSKMGIVDYGGTPVPSQSKSDVSKRKKIIIPVDSIPGLNLGPGETWTHHNEADPKKNDTMFIIKKK